MIVTLTIPDAYVPRYVAAAKGSYPIPTDALGQPLYTDNQWAKQVVINFMKRTVGKYEQVQAMAQIQYTELEDLAT